MSLLEMSNHPITPPQELVEEWVAQVWHEGTPVRVGASDIHIATQAARWGDDQRLKACCEWMHVQHLPGFACQLHAAMRSKPPSLKQQAIADLRTLAADLKAHGLGCNTDTINRALEALSDD